MVVFVRLDGPLAIWGALTEGPVGVGVTVGLGVSVGVELGVAVGGSEGVTLGVGDAVGVGVGVGASPRVEMLMLDAPE